MSERSSPAIPVGPLNPATFRPCVLFDLDGVLVDTEPVKSQAHLTTIHGFGGVIGSEFYRSVMGQSQDAVAQAAIRLARIDVDVREYNRTFERLYEDLIKRNPTCNEGAGALLASLRANGYGCGLVTSSRRKLVDWILKQIGLMTFFDAVVSGEDTPRPKPAPDPYATVLRLLGSDVASAVAFEDSETGVESAVSAGLPVVAVLHGFNRSHDFSKASAQITGFQDKQAVLALIDSFLGSPVR